MPLKRTGSAIFKSRPSSVRLACLRWVKMRNTHTEHNGSALTLVADLPNDRGFPRKGPTGLIYPITSSAPTRSVGATTVVLGFSRGSPARCRSLSCASIVTPRFRKVAAVSHGTPSTVLSAAFIKEEPSAAPLVLALSDLSHTRAQQQGGSRPCNWPKQPRRCFRTATFQTFACRHKLRGVWLAC
jgi:hypothetical protein